MFVSSLFFYELETLVLCQFIQKLGTRGYKKIKELPNSVITIGEPVYVLWNLIISFQDFRGFSPRKRVKDITKIKREKLLECEKLEKLVRNNWVPSHNYCDWFSVLGSACFFDSERTQKVKENFRAHRLGECVQTTKPNSKEPIVQR